MCSSDLLANTGRREQAEVQRALAEAAGRAVQAGAAPAMAEGLAAVQARQAELDAQRPVAAPPAASDVEADPSDRLALLAERARAAVRDDEERPALLRDLETLAGAREPAPALLAALADRADERGGRIAALRQQVETAAREREAALAAFSDREKSLAIEADRLRAATEREAATQRDVPALAQAASLLAQAREAFTRLAGQAEATPADRAATPAPPEAATVARQAETVERAGQQAAELARRAGEAAADRLQAEHLRHAEAVAQVAETMPEAAADQRDAARRAAADEAAAARLSALARRAAAPLAALTRREPPVAEEQAARRALSEISRQLAASTAATGRRDDQADDLALS